MCSYRTALDELYQAISHAEVEATAKCAAIELHVISCITLSPMLITGLQQSVQLAKVVEPNNVHSSSVVRNYLVWGYTLFGGRQCSTNTATLPHLYSFIISTKHN